MPKHSNFKSFFSKIPVTLPILQVYHTCTGKQFRDIVDDGVLKATDCKVFGEKLSYFFYGKPSYRKNYPGMPRYMTAHYPFCFIFDMDTVPPMRRMHPFDTGAFEKGIYSNHIDASMEMADFELNAVKSEPQKVISFFFGENERYIKSFVKTDIEIPRMEFEVQQYYYLISSIRDDDRCNTIEIQTTHDLILGHGRIKALVLPDVFMDDNELKQMLADRYDLRYSKNLLPYPTHLGSTSEYQSGIRQVVDIFISSGVA